MHLSPDVSIYNNYIGDIYPLTISTLIASHHPLTYCPLETLAQIILKFICIFVGSYKVPAATHIVSSSIVLRVGMQVSSVTYTTILINS